MSNKAKSKESSQVLQITIFNRVGERENLTTSYEEAEENEKIQLNVS